MFNNEKHYHVISARDCDTQAVHNHSRDLLSGIPSSETGTLIQALGDDKMKPLWNDIISSIYRRQYMEASISKDKQD